MEIGEQHYLEPLEGVQVTLFSTTVTFLNRGCNFYVKNKIKSEIFYDKKSLQTKMFFSVITKNLHFFKR